MFVANCIAGSLERMSVFNIEHRSQQFTEARNRKLLVTTPPGLQICVRMLDGLSKRAVAEEESDAEEAFQVG